MPSVAHIVRRRHARKRRRRSANRRSTIWLIIVVCIPAMLALSPLAGALGLAAWLYGQAASYVPAPPASIVGEADIGWAQFLDRAGQTPFLSVADQAAEYRRWLPLADLPPTLIDATLLAGEYDFLDREAAFDALSTLLQLWRYIMGLPLERDPGIAGELARDSLLPLTQASGLDKDLLELVLVAENKRRHSAPDLLEWRLNSQYYGHGAYGIEAAAQVYLGKSADSLSLAEAATLAAVGMEPALNPRDEAARARQRADDLLFAMLDAELIDQPTFDEASAAPIAIRQAERQESGLAPAFIEYARAQAEDILTRLGMDGARLLARGGLKITTSLDMDLQMQADCLLRAHLQDLHGEGSSAHARDGADCEAARWLPASERAIALPPDSGALTLIDVGSGQILSLVGAAAAQSHQIGVVVQPFVYMDAFLRRDYTPASMVYDIPRAYPGPSAELIYTAANPDGRHRGPMSLRHALAAGLLPPAAQVASVNGMAAGVRTANALGFNSLDAGSYDLDLLARGGAVSVLDTAYAYSVLASMGAMRGLPALPPTAGLRGIDPVAVLQIEDAAGNLLWSLDEAERAYREQIVVQPSLTFMVNDILADGGARQAVLEQPDAMLQLSRTAAVLDGLSVDRRDSWTVGYTPDLTLAVHVARADQAALSLNTYDRLASAPVWSALMEYAHRHLALPPQDWRAPADIEEYLVCEISGLLPATTEHCPTRREIVPAGSRLRRDDRWQTVEINRSTGQLATVNTPSDLRARAAYFVPPDDVMDWWRENGKALPPSSYSSDGGAARAQPVQITAPADYAYVGATVEIAGEINRSGAESWLLEYGAEANPERWIAIGDRRAADASGSLAATWETALFSGIYSLRLTATFADGSVETDTALLTFDNTPPSVRLSLSAGDGGGQYALGQVVTLVADVRDNLTIERVEFYRDDELLDIDRDWPYGVEHQVDAVGEIAFSARAFDQVGNRAESTTVASVAGA